MRARETVYMYLCIIYVCIYRDIWCYRRISLYILIHNAQGML